MFEAPKVNIQSTPIIKAGATTQVTQPVSSMPKDADLINKENFIMNFSRKFSLILIALLVVSVVIIAVAYYFYVVRFNSHLAALQEECAAKVEINEKLKAWQSDVKLLETEQSRFLQMVPEKKDLGLVLIQLEKLAEKYNLVFNAIVNKTSSFETSISEGGPLQSQSYEVTFSGGDYFTLKKFLAEIESSLRVVVPQALIYSPDVNMFILTFDIYHR